MPRIILLFIFSVFFQASVFAADEKNIVPSILKSATVYRASAELMHTANVQLKQGNNELIIEGLSNALDINSVQVNSDAKLTILSLGFSTEYLKPVVKSPQVKRLEDSLEVLNKQFSSVQVMLSTNRELLDLLKANKEIRGTQTGLSVAELIKMMDYYKTKTIDVQQEIEQYKEKEAKLLAIISKIRMQIIEDEQKNNKSSGKLLLQISSAIATITEFRISYLTNNAFWNPSYDIRVDNISKPIQLLYKAKLFQTTGIDWKQVKLTLATSNPNQHNEAPVLKSWFLSYIDPVARMENSMYMNSIQSLAGKVPGLAISNNLDEVVVTGYGMADSKDNESIKVRGIASLKSQSVPLYVLDGVVISQKESEKIDPKSIKNVTVLKDAQATAMYGSRASSGVILITLKGDLGDYITVNDNELNVTYDIDLPYDVPGKGKEQNISLKEVPVDTYFKYYSVPCIDKDAYLLGELPDWGQLNLLPGEANIMFEGTYIGKTAIDPNSTQDTLNLTLGKDKRIVVKKEKVKDFSSVKFLGSNKKQIFTYDLTVKNNKKEPISMLLKDQYPLSTNKDIEVELIEKSDAANNTELGVLTWKLQLSPGETKKVRVSYSVKYPKDRYVNVGG